MFIDNVFAVTIPANDAVDFPTAPAGSHTIHFCQAKDILICDPPQSVFINSNMQWTIGDQTIGGALSDHGISLNQPGIPTPPFQLLKKIHVIKINNQTPWTIYVFIEDQINPRPTETPSILDTPEVEKRQDEFIPFLAINDHQYRTFNGLATGTYTFIHCYDRAMKRCFDTRTIVLDKDTEWFVYP